MLIQNISAAPTFRLTSDGAPVPVAAPRTETAQVDLPQVAIKAATATEPKTQQPDVPHAQVQSAVDHINQMMRHNNANVEFSIDKDTKQTVIKVVESGTGQAICQFPSEEAVALSRVIGQQMDQQMQRSLLVNQKV